MKKTYKILISTLLLFAIVIASVVYIKTHNIAVLEPKGFIGLKEKDLIITASLLMLIVVIPVFFMAGYFVFKFREEKQEHHAPDWEHNTIAECCWWGVPTVIITCLAVITWKSSFELSPFKALESDKKPITIQVIALQWKWLFMYPDTGLCTLNYLKVPVGTPIHFQITSDAPMNSFWIPQLGGQIYAMPGMRSTINLIADEEGVYQGLSSNISGTGFASMNFKLEAVSLSDYENWQQQAKSSSGFSMDDYNLLVKPSIENETRNYRLSERDLFNQVVMKYMQTN
jgi:cytochrome o ubiquinol oxidase subunit 2